ncbi:MAG: 50S ribosomal protein L25/general stress protein Ctc [Pseudomonadales bacterium]|jgi:large subunit ribosomal protein L25|nr:50S ribosomal protein L25/general stress protein Ctc [Pseudomonadales bacterium]MDP6472656.1 50S ribosomal protein L25/general stress protein Ctc [Pseudomonadales bacterium]MDP6829066.1 50S ribosomal protein L25/general stress protein Ctc [Pseudomonadales bacterium]MDP6971390.1 50S ribosomal protein L25/general stress protein Ctc [Pseudomonadales bacterium]|tara:strand:+ start:1768 stop:2478 length:711 start_codon:yes stop_codon:yes gene_type:complete
MSDQIELTAELRKDVGKGASRRLRRLSEKVPGIIYGADADAQALTLQSNELTKAMQQEAFYSQILNVIVEGDGQQAVVRDLQRHPATSRVMHIDFLRISADKELQVHVPIHFINEDKCVGVRQEGGVLAHNLIEVEISCLPKDLPEFIEVDVSGLNLGHAIHLSNLILGEGATIVALTHGDDHDLTVVSCNQPRVASEEEEEAEAEAMAEAAVEETPDSEAEGDADAGEEERSADE